jgi:hypothetical protein
MDAVAETIEISETRLRPRVLVTGRAAHAEFAEALGVLAATADVNSIACGATLANIAPHDIIVVAQSHPNSVSPRVVDKLREQFPETRIVALLGTWCEGETRTGQPWPDVERVYWYEFPAWWQTYLLQREETAAELQPTFAAVTARTVLVECTYRETFESLADALPVAAVWLQPRRPWPLVVGPVAGVWIGGQLTALEEPRLAQFCERIADDAGPVVALLDFPRHDRVERARQLGATAVLGMPWREFDLLDALGLVTMPASPTIDVPARRDAA